MIGTLLLLPFAFLSPWQDSTVEQIAKTYNAAHVRPLSVEMKLKYTRNGHALDAVVKIDKNKQAFMEANSKSGTYKINIAESGIRESVTTDMVYDEHPYEGSVMFGESRISGDLSAYPSWFGVPKFDVLMPLKESKLVDSKSIGGVVCQGVHVELSPPGGAVKRTVYVDPKGNIRQFDVDSTARGTRIQESWVISGLTIVSAFPAATFGMQIPVGFVPYALPSTYGQLQEGGAFPMTGWRDSKGSAVNLKTLLKGKPGLIAFLDGEQPSQGALLKLKSIQQSVPAIIIGLDGFKGAGILADGGAFDKVRIPATPYFVLVDGKGLVTKMLMGFDPADPTRLGRDVAQALKGN
ncbi:hypothetical protein BH11ARM1_BH11ARM1_12940 [soil metagenome]